MNLQITKKGFRMLEKADQAGSIFPNEIHLLSGLRDGEKHPTIKFEEFKYINPPLNRCIAYLTKNGYAIST